MSHLLCDDMEGGGYLKKVTLDDIGGGGVCGTPKIGDVIKVQALTQSFFKRGLSGFTSR